MCLPELILPLYRLKNVFLSLLGNINLTSTFSLFLGYTIKSIFTKTTKRRERFSQNIKFRKQQLRFKPIRIRKFVGATSKLRRFHGHQAKFPKLNFRTVYNASTRAGQGNDEAEQSRWTFSTYGQGKQFLMCNFLIPLTHLKKCLRIGLTNPKTLVREKNVIFEIKIYKNKCAHLFFF